MPRQETKYGLIWTGGTGGSIHIPRLRRRFQPQEEKKEAPTNTDTKEKSQVNSASHEGDLADLTYPPKNF